MITPEIEEFAKLLIKWVRDAAIQGDDMILRPTVEAPIAKRWRLAARDGASTSAPFALKLGGVAGTAACWAG